MALDGGTGPSGSGWPGRPEADGPADAELLRMHLAGDADAFGTLFLRHSGRLWAVALRIVCDPEDAADALQEAMISAFRRAADFRGDAAVTTWLHRIVVNASLDTLRRRKSRSVAWSGDPDELPGHGPDGAAGLAGGALGDREGGLGGIGMGGPGAEERIATRLDVDAALRVLPPPQRAALVLVDMLGYPVAEAARILDVSEGTVKSRCARGRTRLLPSLSHLRTNYQPGRNQPVGDGVSSEQGGGA